ncbi:site-specific integrase [Streptomyces lavendulocolor]|uniref:hypothetical protein n=1 Tax=Streptomyces lavendulocolor TaxID=67316 RepID=UPI003C307870
MTVDSDLQQQHRYPSLRRPHDQVRPLNVAVREPVTDLGGEAEPVPDPDTLEFGGRRSDKKATPADRRVLRQALAHLDRTTLVGKRDAALMLLGHAIASRGSELAPLDWPASFAELPNGGFRVRVYRKKRKRWQDVEVLVDPEPEMCTVAAVRDLVDALAQEGQTCGPLFLRIDQWGYMGAEMTRNGKPIGDPTGRISVNGAADVVSRSITRAGLPGEWRSHSLRRGFVKSARDAGVDIVDIGRHGGWDDRSKALIGYVDEEDSSGERNPLAQIGKAAVERRTLK